MTAVTYRRRLRPQGPVSKNYIRVPAAIDRELRLIQGTAIATLRRDVPYTEIVNLVLLAGLMGIASLGPADVAKLRAFFLDHHHQPPPLAGRGDRLFAGLEAGAGALR